MHTSIYWRWRRRVCRVKCEVIATVGAYAFWVSGFVRIARFGDFDYFSYRRGSTCACSNFHG